MLRIVATFLCVCLSSPVFAGQDEEALTEIAFGSCNRQSDPQDHWDVINAEEPQAWIWLGDTIYADNALPAARWLEYETVLNDGAYENFRNSGVWITGVWDDHDYAYNGAGREYDQRGESKELFLQFLGLDSEEVVFNREGIYRAYEKGPEGQRVAIILLDTRSFKEDPGRNNELLGEEQWEWLARTLRATQADFIILGSSISVSANINFGTLIEGWGQYDREKDRLITLLGEVDKPMMIITGDRHAAEFSRVNLSDERHIVEFMSSGLTHARTAIPNRNRIGSAYTKTNYGMISIDWEAQEDFVTLDIHSAEDGSVQNTLTIDR